MHREIREELMFEDSRFHAFMEEELEGVELPSQFTYPFHYVPHELCKDRKSVV